MKFSFNSLTAVATVLFAAAGVHANDCDENSGPFQGTMRFGKQGFDPSTPFCHTKWKSGLVVTGVEVWATRWQITGVQFTYSDGSLGPVQGSTNYGDDWYGDDKEGGKRRHDFISWNEKDTITSLKAKTNSAGDGLGALLIEVAGKKLDVYSDNCGDGLDVNYGAGILLGASGETNSFPTWWTPLFLGHPDATVQMNDLTFDEDLDSWNKKQQGMESMDLSEVYIKNSNTPSGNSSDTSHDQSWSFVGHSDAKTSSSLSTTTQNQFGLSVGVEVGGKVGVPFVAEGSVKLTTTASYQYSNAQTRMSGTDAGKGLDWTAGSSVSGDLIKPGHAKHCVSTCVKGHYRGGYTAHMTMTVNGKSFAYDKKGIFDSVSYTTADSDCKDVLISEIPKNSLVKEASDTVKPKRAVAFRA